MNAKEFCIGQIEAARTADYAAAAVAESISAIEQRLASIAGGPPIAALVADLLRAGNAERASRLVKDMPLRPRWVVPVLVASVAAAPLVVGFGIFALISRYTARAFEQAKAASLVRAPTGPRPSDAVLAHLQEIATAFIADVGASRFGDAYARTTPAYREAVTRQRFERALRSPSWRGVKRLTVRRARLVGGSGQVEGLLSTAAGDAEAVFHYSRHLGTWGLTGIVLAGSPGVPPPVP